MIDKGYIAMRMPGAKKVAADILRFLVEKGLSIESINIKEPNLELCLSPLHKKENKWLAILCIIFAYA